MEINQTILLIWNKNRAINPISKRKIKEFGPTYNRYLKKYTEYLENNKNKSILKIQKFIRKKYLEKISGPGYKNPLLCNNNRDIISLDNIWIEKNNNKILNLEFDKILLFTYSINNIIYGLNILSLEQMLNKKLLKDPFTNKKYNKNTLKKIETKLRFIKKLNLKTKKEKVNYNQIIKNKIISILKILENNDIYISYELINSIKKNKYYDIYKELQYIFNYYKSGYNEFYSKIIKKNYFNYNMKYLYQLNFNQLKGFIFDIINTILNENKEEHIQKMSCYIILASLCIVSPKIKECYPNLVLF